MKDLGDAVRWLARGLSDGHTTDAKAIAMVLSEYVNDTDSVYALTRQEAKLLSDLVEAMRHANA